jgi:hypothetical protein
MRNLTETDLEDLRAKIGELATAKECPVVYVEEGNNPKPCEEYKAVVNEKTGKVESIASKGYVIIQHKEAFEAVLDAVAAASKGARFKASVLEQEGKAWMTVVFSDIKADDGMQGIELGIKVTNSYDKSNALKYSGTQKENQEGHFEFFGYRLACMNGMTVRVSMDELNLDKLEVKEKSKAKVGEIVAVAREKVGAGKQITGAASSYIRHYGKNAKANVERVREMMQALPAVAKRLEEQIAATQKISLNMEEATKRLEELGFGPRIQEKMLERYKHEEQTAWGLYNAITAHATHSEKVSPARMEKVLKTAEMVMRV